MTIGTDLVEVERFYGKTQRFYEKIFTKTEIEYCNAFLSSAEHFAGHFAVKEAVMKALGIGLDSASPLEIEMRHLPSKKPFVILSGRAKTALDLLALFNIDVSISHTKKLASATCIIY